MDEISCEIALNARDPTNIEITTITLVLPPGKDNEKIRKELDEMFLGRSTILITEGEE